MSIAGLPGASVAAAILMLLFALAAGVTRAQPEAPDPNEPAEVESAIETAPAAVPDTPLEDYEASEQISEDLSVSFPIDI